MALRAPTICARCGKARPVGKSCPHCPPPVRPQDPNASARFRPYSSPEWRTLRSQVLKAQPLCVVCGSRSEIVDHIKPWKGDPALFLDHRNLQALCRPCHSRKTAREDGGFGNATGKAKAKGCDVNGNPLDPLHPWHKGGEG
ncbi:HNH endonuclease [Rhodospirillum sp. A1_3_36]|uniref:HNH endonuclease n=1 Tax=Rhodospirillum sp. A1_3_36 TaxID=3391666 RepID=UPI0039A72165